MKSISAVCATFLGAALLAASPTLADERCQSDLAAAGLCAPLHFVDSDRRERAEARERRAYEQGYRDARRRDRDRDRDDYRRSHRREVAPPRALGLDGKEGYSQSIEVHRQYLDGDRQIERRYGDADRYDRRRYERRDYERRRYERDDYDRRRRDDYDDFYEERALRDDPARAIGLATQILRGLAN